MDAWPGRILGGLRTEYVRAIVANGRERRLILAFAFVATFTLARIATHTLREESGGGGLLVGGLHIHHVVFGLMLLLASGVLDANDGMPRLRAALFGAGAALVLDEFALVLNLADVYWAPLGRESIDAVVIFAAVLWLGVLGRGFWPAAWRQIVQ